jgi:hypothetical protein
MVNMKSGLLVSLIDRSGSMSSMKREVISGMSEVLKGQADLVTSGQLESMRAFVAQFDYSPFPTSKVELVKQLPIHPENNSGYDILVNMEQLNAHNLPSLDNYQPRGSTALYDAIGYTIKLIGTKLASLPEEERPGMVFFVIVTDGEENSSIVFKGAEVGEMIKHQRDVYSWKFMFIGSDESALKDANVTLNIPKADTTAYVADAKGTSRMFERLNRSVSTEYIARSSNV